MNKGFILVFVLALIFSFNLSVLADEGHDDNVKKATENFRNGTNGDKNEEIDSKDSDDEQKAHSEEADIHSKAKNTHSDAQDNHGEETDTHKDDAAADAHHGPVVETPPNYKVLGAYGTVNLSFILIGVWNKWFRRKGIK